MSRKTIHPSVASVLDQAEQAIVTQSPAYALDRADVANQLLQCGAADDAVEPLIEAIDALTQVLRVAHSADQRMQARGIGHYAA